MSNEPTTDVPLECPNECAPQGLERIEHTASVTIACHLCGLRAPESAWNRLPRASSVPAHLEDAEPPPDAQPWIHGHEFQPMANALVCEKCGNFGYAHSRSAAELAVPAVQPEAEWTKNHILPDGYYWMRLTPDDNAPTIIRVENQRFTEHDCVGDVRNDIDLKDAEFLPVLPAATQPDSKEFNRGLETRDWHKAGEQWPQPYRMVLVATDKFEYSAPAINVGYMKYAAGDLDCPYFVCPGAQAGFSPLFWSDCLGDDFAPPNWKMTQPEASRISSPPVSTEDKK